MTIQPTKRKRRLHSEKRKRQAVVAFRVTPAQRDWLQTQADTHGVSLGAYVRTKALSA